MHWLFLLSQNWLFLLVSEWLILPGSNIDKHGLHNVNTNVNKTSIKIFVKYVILFCPHVLYC